jgi:hypothetical protein
MLPVDLMQDNMKLETLLPAVSLSIPSDEDLYKLWRHCFPQITDPFAYFKSCDTSIQVLLTTFTPVNSHY